MLHICGCLVGLASGLLFFYVALYFIISFSCFLSSRMRQEMLAILLLIRKWRRMHRMFHRNRLLKPAVGTTNCKGCLCIVLIYLFDPSLAFFLSITLSYCLGLCVYLSDCVCMCPSSQTNLGNCAEFPSRLWVLIVIDEWIWFSVICILNLIYLNSIKASPAGFFLQAKLSFKSIVMEKSSRNNQKQGQCGIASCTVFVLHREILILFPFILSWNKRHYINFGLHHYIRVICFL